MELVQRWTKLIWNETQQFTVTKSLHLILRRFKLWSPFQLRVLEDGTPVQDVRFAKGMNVHDILTIFRCLNLGGCVNFPLIQMQTPHQRCGWPNTFPGRWYKSRILLHQCIPRHFDTPMTSMRPWEEPCIIWTDRCLDTQSQIVLETTAQESDWIQLASIWAGTNSPTFLPHIFQACLPLPNLRAHQTQRQCPAGDPDSHTAIPRPGHQFDQDWRLLSLNWQAQRDASTNERYTYGWMWLLDADVIQAWIGALVMQKVFLVFYSGNNQWFQWFLPCRRCFLCTMFGSALLMTVEENFRCTFCDLNEMSQE